MNKRIFNINPSWAVVVIAIAAFFGTQALPYQFTMHSSGRVILWPFLALALGLMALWVSAWISSFKREPVPAPLALLSFLMTTLPLYSVAQQWRCLTGECYW